MIQRLNSRFQHISKPSTNDSFSFQKFHIISKYSRHFIYLKKISRNFSMELLTNIFYHDFYKTVFCLYFLYLIVDYLLAQCYKKLKNSSKTEEMNLLLMLKRAETSTNVLKRIIVFKTKQKTEYCQQNGQLSRNKNYLILNRKCQTRIFMPFDNFQTLGTLFSEQISTFDTYFH